MLKSFITSGPSVLISVAAESLVSRKYFTLKRSFNHNCCKQTCSRIDLLNYNNQDFSSLASFPFTSGSEEWTFLLLRVVADFKLSATYYIKLFLPSISRPNAGHGLRAPDPSHRWGRQHASDRQEADPHVQRHVPQGDPGTALLGSLFNQALGSNQWCVTRLSSTTP